MAQVNNFNFSEEEMNVLMDLHFFKLKHSATAKLVGLFGDLERKLKAEIEHYEQFPIEINISSGKIFRGENYNSYPYVMLDFPRLFSAKSIFAFRSMLWWGNEFSFTLHLQGDAFEHYKNIISEHLRNLKGKGFYCCVNESPWQYTFSRDNYLPLDEMDEKLMSELGGKGFIKLARKLDIAEYPQMIAFAVETFRLLIELLRN